MALDFPANPTNGQVYDSYVYNSTVGAWQAREDSATVAITSPTAPTTANNGDIWYNSNTGVSYLYYADGSSAQWVEIVSSAVPSLDSKADVDGGNTFYGSQIINSSITTVTPLIINGITSQSANLQEWRNATGTAQSLINSSGNFFVGSTQSNYTTTTQLGVKARAAAQIPLSVQAAASQTADLQQWQNSGGTVLAEIDSAGILTTPRVISTQTTGTAPFTVASTTAVTNLNADLLDGNHASAFSTTSHTHSVILSKGTLSAETVRSTHDSGIYTFNTNAASLGDSTPSLYWSTLAWGAGGAGSAELAASWTSNGNELWYRSLRDTTDNWWAWKKINHSGTINTAPLQPSFLATKSDNGNTYSGDYVFNIAMHNTGGYYSTSNGRFTAPVAGRYYFVAECQTYGIGAGTLSTISFKKNGALYMDSSGGTPKTIVNKAVDPTYHNTMVLAMVIDCAANDYITVFTENTRGMQSHFSGYLIG